MTRIVQDGQFGQKLYTRFNVRDRIPLEVEPSIQPVVIMDDLRQQQDIFSVRRASGYALATGGVGFNGAISLQNPAGSGTILAILAMCPIGPGSMVHTIVVGVGGASVVTERYWNTRFGALPSSAAPVGQMRVDNGIGLTGLIIAKQPMSSVGINGGRWLDYTGIFLDENTAILTQSDQGNSAWENTIVWDEINKTALSGQTL